MNYISLMQFDTLPGLTVTVDSIAYDPTRPAPPDRPHPFVYHLSIHNSSPDTVRIFGRKWIVRDSDGDTMVVEGDGVVGQFPNLSPGETFSYTSGCPLTTPSGTMEGTYAMVTAAGETFNAAIPAFSLDSPFAKRVMH